MKIAALSDIHGNNIALDAVLEDIKKEKVNHIFILGDMISDFSHTTREILTTVKSLSAFVIRGNREGYMIGNFNGEYGDSWNRFNQFSINLKTFQLLDTDDLEYINSLPKQISFDLDSLSIRMVHGSPFSEFDMIKENEDDLIYRSAEAIKENILLCGHVHRPMIKSVGEKMIINVGSVGLGFDGDKCAQYTIIEQVSNEVNVEMRKVPYDYNSFKRTCDTENVWVKLCLKSIEDGVDYNIAFLEEAKNYCNEWPIPNDIWAKMSENWINKGII